MSWRAFLVALVIALQASATAWGDPAPIGHVKTTAGSALVVRAGASRPAAVGDALFAGDVLKTGADGSLGVTLKDDSLVSIGPDTEYAIDEFVFAPRERKLSFGSRLVRGTLLVVSGWIAKLAPGSATVSTPTGTLGIRGTRFVVKVTG